MDFAKDLERDAVKIAGTTLAIVVVIVLVQNSGGVAELGRTIFGGWNSTLATLLGRGSGA